MNALNKKSKHHQGGSFIVESVWLWQVLVLLTLGMLQMVFLYKAKATLNTATLQVAREGSITHANKSKMLRKLAHGMAPLYLKKDPNVLRLKARQVELFAALNLPVGAIGRIEIISPAAEVYKKFETKQFYLDADGNEKNIKQMPNDNLSVRDPSVKAVKGGGSSIKINLQDANLLKIRTHWCYKLDVPFVNYILHKAYATGFGDKNLHWLDCRALGLVTGSYYLPVTSGSIVRMQTPIRW